MAAGIIIAVIVAVVCLLLWFMQNSRTRKLVNKIPGPPHLPLIGNAHMLKVGGSEFYDQILGYCNEYDKDRILKLWLGLQPCIALFKPETAEVVLNTNKHISKDKLYDFLHPWIGTGLLTSTGAKWKGRRKLLTPTFHFSILQDFMKVFNEQAQILVSKLDMQADKGTFNIFPYITLCALDIICDTAMGRHVNAQGCGESDYVKAVYRLGDLVHIRQKSPWLWPDVIFNNLNMGKVQTECLHILHTFTQTVIKERRVELQKQQSEQKSSSSGSRYINDDDKPDNIGKRKRLAFLDMLIQFSEPAPLTDAEVQEEVDTFMFEGHDTTAAAMTWATYLLGAHPDIQQEVYEELNSILGDDLDKSITLADVKDMKYLERVIKEALRLYPSVPMFAREISEDCKIGGYDVPQGVTAIVVSSAIHRDPDCFPDPEKFDPDRWLPENCSNRHPYSYVPFSAGLRNCIGQKFAMNEEKVVLANILRNFKVESLQHRDDLHPVGALILRPLTGVDVRLTRRQ